LNINLKRFFYQLKISLNLFETLGDNHATQSEKISIGNRRAFAQAGDQKFADAKQ
jgi:hypothetical protein